MIYVTIEKNEQDEIALFNVEGHAGYAPSGRDIVCAAVSALVVATVNGLEVLTDASIDKAVSSGFTKVFINKPTSSSNILLRSMVMSLEGIQEEYPDNLVINTI
ncbi:ribosomal-processing cysteine protease Prp [Carnobacterium antarcticum]|uniref:Ribosomal processing cysteine protease Prp n=1 Tax=Carnobacterium antarcticum TaxID=2126436 RepID=A0ABW4NPH9_9LACT|nr:ribosomal-processing cysteine protease Prp [Carnobacterium sp. CP1]ALV20746.1 putative ribosomal protein [Carnobacterium sp. CP1]